MTASVCAEFNCGSNASCVVTAANEPLCICDEGYRREGSNCVKGDVDTSVKINVCSNGWCLIPAGTFQMGAPADEACRWKEEGPAHPVTISRPFLMKQTEVTQKEWRNVIGNNPSDKQNCDDCPVEKVSWYDAVYYANKLSGEHGLEACYTLTNETGSAGTGDYSATVTFKGLKCKGYRLPTEAEWEYATRAGTTTAYWIGTNLGSDGNVVCDSGAPNGTGIGEIAWYLYNSNYETHPVKQKLPNPWGLYDVIGNVFEWVYDWQENYWGENNNIYRTCLAGCTDPVGLDRGSYRHLRGGSHYDNVSSLRSAARTVEPPERRFVNVGFRLARSLP